MHARSKMPRSSATGRPAVREARKRCIAHALSLAARRSSSCLAQMHTRTRARTSMEKALRDPSGGDIFAPTLDSLSSLLLCVSELDVGHVCTEVPMYILHIAIGYGYYTLSKPPRNKSTRPHSKSTEF
jgi:hypothetical protein